MRKMSMARRLAVTGLVLALAACGAKRGSEPPTSSAPLRNAKTQISSVVLFEPAQFAGDWYVAQSAVPGCAGARQNWKWDGHGAWHVTGTDCSGGRAQKLDDTVRLTGPGGRFKGHTAFGGETVWLLWADQGYRVAALGTPSGRFAQVLTRSLPPRGDLVTAARQVLDFNGYDIRRVGR